MFLSGRPIALHVLNLGTFAVGLARVIGIPGFLITTDQGERVLVDTGFRDAYAQDARAAAEEDGLTAFGHLVGFGPQLAQVTLHTQHTANRTLELNQGDEFCHPR